MKFINNLISVIINKIYLKKWFFSQKLTSLSAEKVTSDFSTDGLNERQIIEKIFTVLSEMDLEDAIKKFKVEEAALDIISNERYAKLFELLCQEHGVVSKIVRGATKLDDSYYPGLEVWHGTRLLPGSYFFFSLTRRFSTVSYALILARGTLTLSAFEKILR